jgi:hypothetical protein
MTISLSPDARRRIALLLFGMGCIVHTGGCHTPEGRADPGAPPLADRPVASASPAGRDGDRPAPPVPLDTRPYPWHHDTSITPLAEVDNLEQRFAPPPGHERVALAEGSFGAWLRRLPLAKAGTPVLAFDGRTILPPDHRHLAAVVTLDVGTADVQQCADAIMRLHAEWLWNAGRAEEASYASGGGPIAWGRFKAGERPVADGVRMRWTTGRKLPPTHESYRRYLDAVFSWANTVSLAQSSAQPGPDDIRPGDFFILPGAPGHSVLVLDIAVDAAGRRVALLGQSFMPAQSFQVLRPSSESAWFELDPAADVATPFWVPFPWSSLRRIDAPSEHGRPSD